MGTTLSAHHRWAMHRGPPTCAGTRSLRLGATQNLVPSKLSQAPNEILILKLSAIGDVIETLPMLRWLKVTYPAARVSWVCGSSVAELLEAVGGIDRLLVVDEKRLLTGTLGQKIAEVLHLWKRVGGRHFDLILLCHADARYRVLTLPVLSHQARRLNRSSPRPLPLPGRHRASEYLRLATGIDGPDAPLPWTPELALPHSSALVKKLGVPGDKLIGIAPGQAGSSRGAGGLVFGLQRLAVPLRIAEVLVEVDPILRSTTCLS